MLTRERIQEAMDEAVKRGRVTRDDAEELVQDLVSRGRKQTEALISDLEQLVGRSRDQFESAMGDVAKRAASGPSGARKLASGSAKRARTSPPGDRVLRQVDRARRTAGVGSSFPISGFDDLTAAQIGSRLADLSPAELRKVRDYERRNANRKSVLAAIEKKLG
jgi:hypothetical protein